LLTNVRKLFDREVKECARKGSCPNFRSRKIVLMLAVKTFKWMDV